ncbi:hypothetical protein SPV1_02477 [Mariprofundus ferrooxydans PV-1]|uniref:Uncharacterized protein n=1 Tax=Mariprofundus ferrooxydans PV-1 TaxID=314345 RepID=Q0F1X3_9PROT|nr:hypothetical protein SPV1_02477 [Mariprofundus ferrooxydans PV-1]
MFLFNTQPLLKMQPANPFGQGIILLIAAFHEFTTPHKNDLTCL